MSLAAVLSSGCTIRKVDHAVNACLHASRCVGFASNASRPGLLNSEVQKQLISKRTALKAQLVSSTTDSDQGKLSHPIAMARRSQ